MLDLTDAGLATDSVRLSVREIEIIGMAALGLTNGQSAQQLALTSRAIKFHLSSVYRKLDAATRTEAAVRYLNLQREARP